MRRSLYSVAVLAAMASTLAVVTGCVSGGVSPVDGRTAPLLEGLGDHSLAITTDEPLAQRFFDQGLALAYGFNHMEAERSFREAARLDPECAMCWWGVALVLGPNINAPMAPEAAAPAWEAVQNASSRAGRASELEQALIGALESRYAAEPGDDRGPLDLAYADSMREVARAFPENSDAGTLFAEALMDTTPWDYWLENGDPKPVTEEILATLDGVLDRNRQHPGALHLYIHAVEAVKPDLGVEAAELLEHLVPGAGHLVHMPSHIYMRVGRYHEAAEANERAIQADEDYITQCRKQGLYPLAYMPHNRHFLWAAATLEGRAETAITAAEEMARRVDTEAMHGRGLEMLQHFWVTPVYAYARFGRWQEVLDWPEPHEDLLYPRGVRHYARGLAHARQGQVDSARQEYAALAAIVDDPALAPLNLWDINDISTVLTIAREVLAGEIAAAEGDYPTAVRHLEKAVEVEDSLLYTEPHDWHHPARQTLGAILLEAGEAARAESVYRADLENFPANGWSLYGLQQSYLAQGDAAGASRVAQELETAWRYADIELPASRF